MKKIILIATIILLKQLSYSQIQLPKNITQNNTLPKNVKIPKVKIPTQTDLSVSNLRLLSIVKDESASTYTFRYSYTIKNNGEIATNANNNSGFGVIGYNTYEVIMPMYDLPHNGIIQDGVPDAPWRYAAEIHNIYEPIAGNSFKTIEQEVTLTYNSETEGKKFRFVVGVDVYNTTNETKRDNNFSNVILITPPNR